MNSYLDLWRSPFSMKELDRMQRSLDRMQDDFFATPGKAVASYTPKLELSEDKNKYVAKFDLPGLSKDQIKVEMHDSTLTVSGERRLERKDEKSNYTEITYGSFTRTITLPTAVDAEKISASFENGVLTVGMEKKTASNMRQISIK